MYNLEIAEKVRNYLNELQDEYDCFIIHSLNVDTIQSPFRDTGVKGIEELTDIKIEIRLEESISDK